MLKARIALKISLALLVGIGLVYVWYPAPFVNAWETVAYAIDPSAQRAYDYGAVHFTSRDPKLYDIDRAEYFFSRAAFLSPALPYVNHQLARVAFLRGDMHTALMYINREITAQAASTSPSTYYVKGLILGYMGRYDESAQNYERYLNVHPSNWAALNDYAWVLLKAGRAKDAADALKRALLYAPENPWLLNSYATALYESKKYKEAYEVIQKAAIAVAAINEGQWLHAYPGNDPKIAGAGITAFQSAVEQNVHMMALASTGYDVQ